MCKHLFWILFLLLVVSCKKEAREDNMPQQEEITKPVKLPELQQFDADKQEEVDQWAEYANLNRTIQEFRREKGGDVALQLDDLLEKEKELSASAFPEKFDNPSVRSRLTALRTYLLQTRLEAPDPVPEKYLMEQKVKILNAYNALHRQLYVMMQGSVTDEFLNELSNRPVAKRDTLKRDSLPADSVPSPVRNKDME